MANKWMFVNGAIEISCENNVCVCVGEELLSDSLVVAQSKQSTSQMAYPGLVDLCLCVTFMNRLENKLKLEVYCYTFI